MRRLILMILAQLAVSAAVAVPTATRAAGADPAFGLWLTPGGSAKVRVGPCAGHPSDACGILVWLRHGRDGAGAPVRDVANPDPRLRTRPLAGVALIGGFRRTGPGRWTDGHIYDPDTGKTYRSTMSVASDGTLDVAGCVLVICRSQTWTRAAD